MAALVLDIDIAQHEQVRSYALKQPEVVIRSTASGKYSTTYFFPPSRKLIVSEVAYGITILGLISKVKSEARKAPLLPSMECTENDLVRYTASPEPINLITDVFEYDKSAAYATAALKLGFISEGTFSHLMQMQKRFRLSILGSLGTKKIIETYSNGERVELSEERDAELYKRWLAIVGMVGREMTEHFLNTKSFAFWVDALYSFAPLTLSNPEWKMQLLRDTHVVCNGKSLSIWNRKKDCQHLLIPCYEPQSGKLLNFIPR